MGFVVEMIVGAALLGVIVSVREGEFPGWGPMVGVVLAAGLVQGWVQFFVPTPYALLGSVCGAGAAVLLMCWLLESGIRRNAVTAGVWLGALIVLSILWSLIS